MAVRPAELTVVVPTFNERDNVGEVIRSLDSCLGGVDWEVVFVDDDSPDGTAEVVRRAGRTDARVRCIQRIGRRGLSSACVEGMLASSAPYLAVMDADGQHDELMIPRMLDLLRAGQADLVVGSRYTGGGSVGAWERRRALMSLLATRLSRALVKCDLTDPMSGFFAVRRPVVDDTVRGLSTIGFKILLDLVASSPRQLRVTEVAYQFRSRRAGVSKLDSQALWGYLMLLADKLLGRYLPVRFIAFALVGAIGIAAHLAVLSLLFKVFELPFAASQAVATLAAMTSNFALNNALTYRDMRLKGWSWLKGWATFTIVCALGALANVGIAAYLFANDTVWMLAAVAGIAVGAVWNYVVTAKYTWDSRAGI